MDHLEQAVAGRERIEIRDGVEYRVVRLPQDPALTPSAARKRALWGAMSKGEKARYFRDAKAKAKAKRKRRRRK